MAAREMVTLRVRGEEHHEWKRIEITRSLDSFPPGFSLDLATGTAAPAIRCDDACEILLGSDAVLMGYIGAVEQECSGEARSYSVSGQSKVVDASKCSVTGDPSEFLSRTIIQIATALCVPYSLVVEPDIFAVEIIERFVPEFGETVYVALERLCRDRGLIVTDNPAGDLVLARLGTLRATDLTPENVKRIRLRSSSADRFSEYRVYGQTQGNDMTHGASAAHPWASIEDDEVGRFRLLVLRAEQQADIARCKARATWEAVTRAARSATCSVQVQGWRDENGAIRVPNRLCRVRYPLLGLDAELLVTQVTLRISDQDGIVSDLTLMPPGGFEMLAPMERVKQGKKKITADIWAWSEDVVAP